MEKALLYKEWKKTRLFAIGILMVGMVLMLYIFISIGRSFRMVGMEHLWDVIVNKKQFLYRDIKYFPVAAGLCIATAQFVPEIIQNRIKLTLHLPLKENRMIKIMLAYGLAVLMITFVMQNIMLFVFASTYFSKEFVVSVFETIVPWFLAGVSAYLLIVSILLEPTWKMRMIYIFMGLGTIRLFFLSDLPGAMVFMMWVEIVIVVLLFPLSLLSVQRFKNGNIH